MVEYRAVMTAGITRLGIAISGAMVLLAAAGLGIVVLVNGLTAGINDWVRLWIAVLVLSVLLLAFVVRPQLRRGLSEWRAHRSARDGLTMAPRF